MEISLSTILDLRIPVFFSSSIFQSRVMVTITPPFSQALMEYSSLAYYPFPCHSNSSGTKRSRDRFSSEQQLSCDVFSVQMLRIGPWILKYPCSCLILQSPHHMKFAKFSTGYQPKAIRRQNPTQCVPTRAAITNKWAKDWQLLDLRFVLTPPQQDRAPRWSHGESNAIHHPARSRRRQPHAQAASGVQMNWRSDGGK